MDLRGRLAIRSELMRGRVRVAGLGGEPIEAQSAATAMTLDEAITYALADDEPATDG
jgi:hypothetical protein